jgi:phosphatidylinositol-3,4,5-trisphosphate 3-phosphatase/dual-specificity protein phosphatase PTEN
MEDFNNFFRAWVSGESKRVVDGEFNLDITAITPRIYAMGFPAIDNFEKLYRNSIKKVKKYMDNRS